MTTTTMPKAIAQTIKARRQAQGMTLADFGTRVAELTGNQSWANRGLVSQAENGDRDFKSAELVAIAYVLGMKTWTLLLVDPLEAQTVNLGGEEVSVDALQPLGDLPDPDSAANQISEARTLTAQLSDQAERGAKSVAKAQKALLKAISAMADARADTDMYAETAADAAWMLASLHKDVARYAHGSTTKRSTD